MNAITEWDETYRTGYMKSHEMADGDDDEVKLIEQYGKRYKNNLVCGICAHELVYIYDDLFGEIVFERHIRYVDANVGSILD